MSSIFNLSERKKQNLKYFHQTAEPLEPLHPPVLYDCGFDRPIFSVKCNHVTLFNFLDVR